MNNIAINIKRQIRDIDLNIFPIYSYKLIKLINIYARYIRTHVPKNKQNLRFILLDLFEIKRMICQKMIHFPNFESLENIHDVIVATIYSVVKIQYRCNYITKTQYFNYLKFVIKLD